MSHKTTGAKTATAQYASISFGIVLFVIVIGKFAVGNSFIGEMFVNSVPNEQMFSMQVNPPFPSGVVSPSLRTFIASLKSMGNEIEGWEKIDESNYILSASRRDALLQTTYHNRLQFSLDNERLYLSGLAVNGVQASPFEISMFMGTLPPGGQ